MKTEDLPPMLVPNVDWPEPASGQLGGLWNRDQIDSILARTCAPLLAEIERLKLEVMHRQDFADGQGMRAQLAERERDELRAPSWRR